VRDAAERPIVLTRALTTPPWQSRLSRLGSASELSFAEMGYSLCYRSLSSTADASQKRQNRVIRSGMEQKVLLPALMKRMPELVQSRGFCLRES
jgi:hypothetical protein